MANKQSTGLKPVRHLNGAPWNGQTIKCSIESGHSGSLFIGDPVVLTGSADATGAYPTVGIASAGAGNPVFGVITSFDANPTDLTSMFFLTGATPGRLCNVCYAGDVLFEAQGNSAGVIAATDVGALAALVATPDGTTTGNVTTGISSWGINYTGIATTNSLQVRIMGAVDRPDNDITAIYAKWLVFINIQHLTTGASNASAGTTYLGAVGV